MSEHKRSLPDKYEVRTTSKEDTGLRLFGLEDQQSKISTYFAEFNDEFDVHAAIAWVGARTSRSDRSYPDLFSEIVQATEEGRYSAGKKLSNVFIGYGHASVADMAPVMLYINRLPMHEAFWMFNHTSVGAGQELSTRYVEIEDLDVPSLAFLLGYSLAEPLVSVFEQDWQNLQSYLSSFYEKWSEKLRLPLEQYLSSNAVDIDEHKKSIDARVLDVARMWIPLGARTSMTLLSSARNIVDISSQLRSTKNTELESLGEQMVTLLKLKGFEGFDDVQAELGDLTKYHEGSDVIRRNLTHLRQYALGETALQEFISKRPTLRTSPHESRIEGLDRSQAATNGQLLLVQQLLTAFPSAEPEKLTEYVGQLEESELEDFSSIIFADHTHHELLRNAADHRGVGFLIETALAYHRDYNRHRAMGRLVLALETDDFESVMHAGPNKNFALSKAKYWSQLSSEWNKDMARYYRMFYEFKKQLDSVTEGSYDERILINMLPLGHQVRMLMSGPINQWQYFTSLRIGLGGDFGYRSVAWSILEELRKDPVLRKMNPHLQEPDPNDIEQILGRS